MSVVSKRREVRRGCHVVEVPLANDLEPAIVETADFDHLVRLGFSDQWTMNFDGAGTHGIVRVADSDSSGGLLTVARLITFAGRGQTVKYLDGNPHNLRRPNLYLFAGRAGGREREAY